MVFVGGDGASNRYRLQASCASDWLCLAACYSSYRYALCTYLITASYEPDLQSVTLRRPRFSISSGASKMVMTVSIRRRCLLQSHDDLVLGEILEKATRVLTDDEKALLETEFVGKNGQRRKLEVSVPAVPDCQMR